MFDSMALRNKVTNSTLAADTAVYPRMVHILIIEPLSLMGYPTLRREHMENFYLICYVLWVPCDMIYPKSAIPDA